MNKLTQSKVVLALAAIFLAGGISGAVVSLASNRKAKAGEPTMERACVHMRDKLRKNLDLSADQLRVIEPILEETGRELQAVQKRAMEDVEQIFLKSDAKIASHLNPEQRGKLEAMAAARKSVCDTHGRGPGPWEAKRPGETGDSEKRPPLPAPPRP